MWERITKYGDSDDREHERDQSPTRIAASEERVSRTEVFGIQRHRVRGRWFLFSMPCSSCQFVQILLDSPA